MLGCFIRIFFTIKMRVLLKFTLVLYCTLFLCGVHYGVCEDAESQTPEELDAGGRSEEGELKKDGKSVVHPGGVRRTTTQASANATRDSQLLSLAAARRRQLLSGRLASHISTIASIAQKNKSNTTFAQLEVRDSNNSIVKKITFENSSNEAIAPLLKFVTNDGSKETKQEIKPHEIRHLFVPKIYSENKSRAGFLNNRRKNSQENITDSNGGVYIPPEKLEGLDKEIELDPEEEFQVDESSHGVFLLNYTENENDKSKPDSTNTTASDGTKEILTEKIVVASLTKNVTDDKPKVAENEAKPQVLTTTVQPAATASIEKTTKTIKNDSEKDNKTLFMSDELYNHFHPLETELSDAEMAPFIYFGQKLGGSSVSDNLTNAPSLSASTKSVNYIVTSPERRKFNSRYSATEKYKNASADEEEVNEDMDVSVVKNIIEKNKIRNSVKGQAPGRHVGLVNAYRKQADPTSKAPTFAELNVTEPMVSISPPILEKYLENNQTNIGSLFNDTQVKNASLHKDEFIANNVTSLSNARSINVTASTPRNYTRTYQHLRRRPARLTATSSTESFAPIIVLNSTTEKSSTLVYTAVVTSVSITSSMKGINKTEGLEGNDTEPGELLETKESSVPKGIVLNITETTTQPPLPPSSTHRPFRAHRIRIRTTTTESTLNQHSNSVANPKTETLVTSETSKLIDLPKEPTISKYTERLNNLYKIPVDNSTGTVRPKNILKRRRPTTALPTTPSSTISITTVSTDKTTPITTGKQAYPKNLITTTASSATYLPTTEYDDTTENTYNPVIVTSRTSSKSSSKPFFVPSLPNSLNGPLNNITKDNNTINDSKEDDSDPKNEEVLIEAEKTYTASYVLAGLGFLPVVAIIVFVLRSFLNKKTKEIDTEYEGYFDDSDIKKESPITPVARPQLQTQIKPDQKWEFPRNKLRLQTLLGQGNFGQVWKAEADDLTGHDGLTRLVAVKSIKETASQKEKQELLHEIYVMQKIGTHPNVVTLLACCTEQEPYLLIMEYVMCGKLLTYLRERRSRPDRFSGSGALTSRDLTVFAYCVARGMDYIASKGIVHRDLAARNVLVDHNKLCKIADFGMSREVSGNEDKAKQRHALPVRWMAPEALLYNTYSHETDVWAYGILLWEIVTLGSTPYAAMSGREVLSAVTEGYRLERPPHCKPQLYRAMHSCWHADSTQRPSFASLKSNLANLLDNEPAEGNYVDLDSFYQESSVYSDPSAIIHDDEGLSSEYDRERRCFRELAPGPPKFDNRSFNFREEDLRNKFSIGTQRMGGFGIRDVPFNERNFTDPDYNERTFKEPNFVDRNFSDGNFSDGNFSDRNFNDANFGDRNFHDGNFVEKKDGKLSTSSFHRERERQNPLVSRNSFNGFPRLGNQNNHFQLLNDGRNKRVSEFECDI